MYKKGQVMVCVDDCKMPGSHRVRKGDLVTLKDIALCNKSGVVTLFFEDVENTFKEYKGFRADRFIKVNNIDSSECDCGLCKDPIDVNSVIKRISVASNSEGMTPEMLMNEIVGIVGRPKPGQ